MKKAWILLLPAALLFTQLAQAAEPPPPRIVAVNGLGEVSTKPDRARLNVAADALNVELKTAEATVNKIVRAYLAEAKALGIKDEKISTAGINISPEYVWDEKQRQQKLVGYRARRDIEVVIDDLDKLGDFVLRATKVGINHVSSPVLESSKSDTLSREALVKAANDALSKAKLLADTLGMKLGPPRSVRVNDFTPGPVPMVKAMSMRGAEMAADAGNQEMGFSGGEIKYTANAAVEFDLLEK